MGASISANHGSHCFINLKRGDSHPTHNSNPTCTGTYIHPPPPLPAGLLPVPQGHNTSYWLCQFPAPTQPVQIPRTILPLTYFIHLPMKMGPIVSSETSAIGNQTPGNYPKRNQLQFQLLF